MERKEEQKVRKLKLLESVKESFEVIFVNSTHGHGVLEIELHNKTR